jgi:hypothetical protein
LKIIQGIAQLSIVIRPEIEYRYKSICLPAG